MRIGAICSILLAVGILSLPGLLLTGFVVLFLMGFSGTTMRAGGAVVQIGSSLMVLVMRSVFVTVRHLKAPYLTRLGMSFPGELISLIRIIQRSLRMIFCRCGETAFFVMFGGGTMCLRRQFVKFGGLSMFLMHAVFSF
jgi:hypothetical protein